MLDLLKSYKSAPIEVKGKEARTRLAEGEVAKPWSTEEVALLEKYYSDCEREQIEELFPTRSWEAIKYKAHKLGLRMSRFLLPKGNRAWTEKEDDVLRANYGKIPKVEWATLMPNRTYCAVKTRAYSLGLTLKDAKC